MKSGLEDQLPAVSAQRPSKSGALTATNSDVENRGVDLA